jgi:hypothetical protein
MDETGPTDGRGAEDRVRTIILTYEIKDLIFLVLQFCDHHNL